MAVTVVTTMMSWHVWNRIKVKESVSR